MSKNQVQFQTGYSLLELFANYGTEEQCRQSLFSWKWPEGFVCPECGSSSFCALKSRPVYQCNHCHHQTSLTSGTIFASTNLPLTPWFFSDPPYNASQNRPVSSRAKASNWRIL